MNNSVLGFVAVAAFIGALIGVFIGSTIRGARARRQEQRLNQQLSECQQELRAAHDPSRIMRPPTSRSPRLTGSEVAKVLLGIASLLGSISGLYAVYNGHEVKDLQKELAKANGEVQDHVTKITQLLGLSPEEWLNLKLPSNPTSFPQNKGHGRIDYSIDGRHLRGNCNPKALSLTFGLVTPSVLHCEIGSAVIHFGGSSRILVIPDNGKS